MAAEAPRPGEVWVHANTQSRYLIWGVGTNSTNGPNNHEEMVAYWSFSKQTLHFRELNQFTELVEDTSGMSNLVNRFYRETRA